MASFGMMAALIVFYIFIFGPSGRLRQ